MTRGASASVKKVGIKDVLPYIPEDEKEKAELLEDLERMGCEGLAKVYWGIKDPEMLKEFLDGATNVFDNSIRADTTKWKAEVFRAAYGFQNRSGSSIMSLK